MKFLFVLTVFGLSLTAEAGTVVCDYTALSFPPVRSGKMDLDVSGSFKLDSVSAQPVFISHKGNETKKQYTFIANAWNMVDGIQIQAGLYTGVKVDAGGTGYTGFPIASSLTTFGAGQKDIRLLSFGAYTSISINCKP